MSPQMPIQPPVYTQQAVYKVTNGVPVVAIQTSTNTMYVNGQFPTNLMVPQVVDASSYGLKKGIMISNDGVTIQTQPVFMQSTLANPTAAGFPQELAFPFNFGFIMGIEFDYL